MNKLVSMFVCLFVVIGLIAGFTSSPTPVKANVGAELLLEAPMIPALVLQYQGKLLDTATGLPKPNASYSFTFKLYDVATGGAALWTETKNISTSSGLFSTLLGDLTALPTSIFDGRLLWLGVAVAPDAEATPRQRVAHQAYALFSHNADLLDGSHASAFALITHAHAAGDISTGTLSTDRFSAFADLVAESKIGFGASQVPAGDHNHDTRYFTEAEADTRFVNTSGPETISSNNDSPVLTVNQTGAGGGGDFNSVGGISVYGKSSQYVGVWGTHTGAGPGWGVVGTDDGAGIGGYFTSVSGTALYAEGTGVVTGNLDVGSITYHDPKVKILSVPGEAFSPANDVLYQNRGGMGGAFIYAGENAMTAPLYLPNGAIVTELKVFFYDNSASNLVVALHRLNLTSGGYAILAEVTSAGTPGYYSSTDAVINYNPINNTGFGYFIDVYCTNWDSANLRIMGAVITYTIIEP